MSDRGRVPRRRVVALLGAASLALLGGAVLRLGPPFYNGRRLRALSGRRVYDENADAPALLAAALERASREEKRVLVVLGGNWCKWCLALDDLMSTDAEIRSLVDRRLILLKLDAGAAEGLDRAWGHPTENGVPVFVFLGPDGHVLHVQETVSLETWGGRVIRHDPGRLLEVLQRWG